MARDSYPGPIDDLPFMNALADFSSIRNSLMQLNTDFMYIILRSRSKFLYFFSLSRFSTSSLYTFAPISLFSNLAKISVSVICLELFSCSYFFSMLLRYFLKVS